MGFFIKHSKSSPNPFSLNGSNPFPGSRIPQLSGITWAWWRIEDVIGAHLDPVASWIDCESGFDAVAAGSARPLLRTDGAIDTGREVRFDAVDDEMYSSGHSIDMSAGMSVFAVFQRDSANTNLEGPTHLQGTTSAYIFEYVGHAVDGVSYSAVNRDATIAGWQVTGESKIQLITPTLWSARHGNFNPSDNPVRINNAAVAAIVEVGTAKGITTPVESFRLGMGYPTGGRVSKGMTDIAYAWGRELTEAEHQRVDQFFTNLRAAGGSW